MLRVEKCSTNTVPEGAMYIKIDGSRNQKLFFLRQVFANFLIYYFTDFFTENAQMG